MVAKSSIVSAICICTGLNAGPAFAKQPIEADPAKAWVHSRTQVSLPSEMMGLGRVEITDFGTEQYDVIGNYASSDDSTLLTVYLYRAGFAEVSASFDAVLAIVSQREGFDAGKLADYHIQQFQPDGHPSADSLMAAWDISPGGRFASSGVALVPHGQWLLKLRISSRNHKGSELPQLMRTVVSDLALPVPGFWSPESYLVEPCASALETRKARIVPTEGSAIALQAVASLIIGKAQNEDGEPIQFGDDSRWCRDDGITPQRIYRPEGTRDRYVIYLNDAGHVLRVGETTSLGAVLQPKVDGVVSVTYANSEISEVYPPLDSLPAPGQLDEIYRNQRILARTDRDQSIEMITDPKPK